jgi:hypothetical protein
MGLPLDENINHVPGYAHLNNTQPQPLKGKFRQYQTVWLLGLVALTWSSFTMFFAFNISRIQPPVPSLVLPTPQLAILAVNIFSHITIFLLGELVISVFEACRWSLASSSLGISAFSFIIMSRATSNLGVLRLVSRLKTGSGKSFRLWGMQR